MNSKANRKQKLKWRIRKKISGNTQKPRLSVYRSNKEIYAQLIDDTNGTTIASANSRNKSMSKEGTKIEIAKAVGLAIAEVAKSKGIESCVFDRGGNLYHGRVKSLAEGAREGGLNF
ncbi:MAG: 50S ribosomal protein L18 [Chitinophagaceae bacterium]|nr:50S ribosomal protein L18 [Chitinophagaceae bacterium]HMN33423.1 50S ribosomal protein L18 [Chitinophagaceae bacterium]